MCVPDNVQAPATSSSINRKNTYDINDHHNQHNTQTHTSSINKPQNNKTQTTD
jgi:hypothetical protein